MRLPHFQHFVPVSIEEACSLLAEYGSEAVPLAGGTDLLVKMKQRKKVPNYVVNLKNIPGFDYITYDEKDGLKIGALATIQSLKNSVVVKRHCKILAQAAGVESSVQIRNIATIGGNIANASPAADAPLALVSLTASLVITRLGGEREILIEGLCTGPGKTKLQPGEIIREIHVPPLPPRSGGAYLKHAIRRTDIAIVSTAVVVTLADDLCADIKIALGSVAPTAFRAKRAEEFLKGKKITAELAEEAGRVAMEESHPIDDIRGYAEHRQKIIVMLTKQAIMEAVRDARLGS
jgi:aerobic carbon-monoxide dehydrogenase medium subunit